MEFHHINTEMGYTYHSSAVIDDGSAPHRPVDPVRVYEPRTKPGHPLPHAFVEREGERLPLGNLAHNGRFLVLAGEQGQAWVEAARAIAAQTGIPINRGHSRSARQRLHRRTRCMDRNREINPTGAILVRPDRYIAYRSLTTVDDPAAALRDALAQVLSTAPG